MRVKEPPCALQGWLWPMSLTHVRPSSNLLSFQTDWCPESPWALMAGHGRLEYCPAQFPDSGRAALVCVLAAW